MAFEPLKKVFAENGTYTVPPEAASTTVANQDTGFPVLQATPLASGGLPVSREEVNGVFNFYSEYIFNYSLGNTYDADATNASYSAYRSVVRDILSGQALFFTPIVESPTGDPVSGTSINSSEWKPISNGFIDQSIQIDLTSDAAYTLTDLENLYENIYINDPSGFLTTSRNIVVSSTIRTFRFYNNTLQDLVVKTSAGTGIIVFASNKDILYCDGTNIEVDIASPLGVNQIYKDFTGSKTGDTIYTNVSGKTIGVAIHGRTGVDGIHLYLEVDGDPVAFTPDNATATYDGWLYAPVPSGSEFELKREADTGSFIIDSWKELRN